MDARSFGQTQDSRYGRLFNLTTTAHRAQKLLDLWDALKARRSCRDVIDIQEHKDNLNGLASIIRLGIYAEYRTDVLESFCNQFEVEYFKVRNKLHNDLIDGLRTK
jgi:hypothetical protein